MSKRHCIAYNLTNSWGQNSSPEADSRQDDKKISTYFKEHNGLLRPLQQRISALYA
jgi:hypothetical protein